MSETKISHQLIPAGRIVQVVNNVDVSTTTFGSPTSVPIDTTAPLWSEGAEITALQTSITPKASANILLVQVNVRFTSSAGRHLSCALFKDPSGSDPCVASSKNSHVNYDVQEVASQPFFYSVSAGGISLITFKIRIGGNSTSGVTLAYNRDSGQAIYGGTLTSSIIIWELAS